MISDRPCASSGIEVFHANATTHPARQAWLLRELEEWFAGELPDGCDRRRIVGRAVRAATADAHRWLGERLEADDVVRVDLHITSGLRRRHSVFPSVPCPLTLLLICLDQCRVGDEVLLVQELAESARVEARATWPFAMEVAQTLTRPAWLPSAAGTG